MNSLAHSSDLAAVILSAALERLVHADSLLDVAAKLGHKPARFKNIIQPRQEPYRPIMLAENEARSLVGLLTRLQASNPTHRQVFEYLQETQSPLIGEYHAAWQAPLLSARSLNAIRERCELALPCTQLG
ncbi:hypothetical protein [Paludibacterium purpuratum]|uniref:Uncharacterized protein n=1 Tax=Paludibacterium purpuratum TaxID=1144873 RepID=A0A4R7B4E7_9NEIS|nr:hypothetical protein [Paludibacterium purpuratum]TDR78441.1 hypothetical protein DFP86_108160 [Paludibacterium purpuratum]